MVQNNNGHWRNTIEEEEEQEEQMSRSSSYYHSQTLTRDEMSRMHPCKKVTAKCVMMSTETSQLQSSSIPALHYVELPEEPRPGKITPHRSSSPKSSSTPTPTTNHHNPEEDEVIEEAVPIVRTTLPSPEPRPTIERNGHAHTDQTDKGNGTTLLKPPKEFEMPRDVNDDSCLIKCVYFTQQCCECTIV